MSKSIHKIDDIIKTLNSAITFYEDAKLKVKDPTLATLFHKMMMIKTQTVTRLTPFVVMQEGEIEDGSSFAVEARKMYANILAKFSSNSDHAIVEQLEEVEDKTLDTIEEAMDRDQPPEVLTALREVYQDMRTCHDEILATQRATA